MIFILAIISIILVTLFYKKTTPTLDDWQKVLLIFLRSTAVIVLLLLLLNPIVYYFQSKTNRPVVVVLNDVSASMKQSGNGQKKIDLNNEFRDEIDKDLNLKGYYIASYNFANGLDGEESSTNLSKTFAQVFKKIEAENIQAIVLLSDGWFHDEELDVIEANNIPIFTFDPHFQSEDFDLKITRIEHNKTVYRDEITPIEVDMSSQKYFGKARLELISDNKLLSERRVNFKDKEFQKIVFDTSFSDIGFAPITLKISTDSTEVNTENNLLNSAIQVKRNRSKAILISDVLDWDVKFISSAVNEDQHWECKYLLKNRSLQDAGKNTSLNIEISDVNLLTLINNGKLRFSANEVTIIDRFVINGGGLFIVGKPIKELEHISPAAASRIHQTFNSTISLTEQSKQYNTFTAIDKTDLNNIPPVSYYYVNPKIESKILARFNDDERSSAILFSHFGKGKILMFAFHDLWKWQLWNSGNSYNKFIYNIFSWLGQTSSERFYSSLAKNSFFLGEEITIDLHAFDETLSPVTEINAEISVINSESKIIYQGFMLKEDNKYKIKFSDLQSGKYKYIIFDEISKSQSEGEFIISQNSPEYRDTGINLALLSYISNKTNGKLIDNLNDLNILEAKQEIIKLRSEIPIYNKWYIIAIFLLVFCTELFLRKRWGLL